MMITKKYKIINAIRPSLTTDRALELLKSVTSFSHEEEKSATQSLSLMKTSYLMDRNSEAHYSSTIVELSKERSRAIRRKMEMNETFLRTMLLNADTEFEISPEFIKKHSYNTSRRGRILFPKNLKRKEKVTIARNIKRLRFIGLLPYVSYV